MRYVDTSAFLKLLINEEHSGAMAAGTAGADMWSSTLLAVEAHRAALRLGVPASEVDSILDGISLVLPSAATFHAAQAIGAVQLRALGALHLAAAAELGPDLEDILTYDARLAASAASLGFVVNAPGWSGACWQRPTPPS